jgi:hypothetical protein
MNRGAFVVLSALWLCCAHGSPSGAPDLEKLRASGPEGLQAARDRAAKECSPRGAPPQACCAALMEEGDMLWARHDESEALAAYNRARNRCPMFAPVRRHMFLMKHAAQGATRSQAVDVHNLEASVDFHLGEDIRLAWYQLFLDGELASDRPISTTVGPHELWVELYLESRRQDEAPVRLDALRAVEIPSEVAEGRGVIGKVRLRLAEQPGANLAARVVPTIEPPVFSTEEMRAKEGKEVLEMIAAQRKAVPRPASASTPVDPSSTKLLPPATGARQLLTPRDRWALPTLPAPGVVWGLFKVCVTPQGAVDHVEVLKSAARQLDGDFVAMIQKFEYRPYLINGTAVTFCYPMRIELRR